MPSVEIVEDVQEDPLFHVIPESSCLVEPKNYK